MTRTETVGGRLAQLRKLAGLTPAALATRAHLSTSLVKQVEQVEQGRKPASPSFTAAVARALVQHRVSPSGWSVEPLARWPRPHRARFVLIARTAPRAMSTHRAR